MEVCFWSSGSVFPAVTVSFIAAAMLTNVCRAAPIPNQPDSGTKRFPFGLVPYLRCTDGSYRANTFKCFRFTRDDRSPSKPTLLLGSTFRKGLSLSIAVLQMLHRTITVAVIVIKKNPVSRQHFSLKNHAAVSPGVEKWLSSGTQLMQAWGKLPAFPAISKTTSRKIRIDEVGSEQRPFKRLTHTHTHISLSSLVFPWLLLC